MCANKRFLTTLLRDTWGFDGIVVSDCQAISNELSPGHNYTNNITSAVALSIRAGTDTDCGAGGTYAEEYRDYIQAAMAEGLLSEADLDTAVSRVLKATFQLGELLGNDTVPAQRLGVEAVDSPLHR